jgi:hypothetical protein
MALQNRGGKDHSGNDGKIVASSSTNRQRRNRVNSRETATGDSCDSQSTMTEGEDEEGNFEWIECSRSASFRQYFYVEQLELVAKLVERSELIKTDGLTTKVSAGVGFFLLLL